MEPEQAKLRTRMDHPGGNIMNEDVREVLISIGCMVAGTVAFIAAIASTGTTAKLTFCMVSIAFIGAGIIFANSLRTLFQSRAQPPS